MKQEQKLQNNNYNISDDGRLAKLNRNELFNLARNLGLKVTSRMTKGEIQGILVNFQKEG